MKKIITIVDDEPDILNLVAINLKKAGFETKQFEIADELHKFSNQLISRPSA